MEVGLAPFGQTKVLFQAVLEEMKSVRIESATEMDVSFFKDLFCFGFSSKKIEQAMAPIMLRSLYNGLKITDETFEPAEAREDYLTVCLEVATENLQPFMKTLTQKFSTAQASLKGSPA